MPYYKSADGRLHFIEDEQFERLLPPQSQKISDEEAEELIVQANQEGEGA